jgi:hypothetical protein
VYEIEERLRAQLHGMRTKKGARCSSCYLHPWQETLRMG